MPKQVNGHDGDLGKPLARRKRALEKKIQGAGDTVVGRMATRSATKAKKVGLDPMSSSENDALLFTMFREWAKKHQKYYKTKDEENERFKIWRSCKEWCDANTSHEPGGVKYGLNSTSDLTPKERCKRRKVVDVPRKIDLDWEKSYWDSESGKAVTEAKEAFFKWVAEHKKDYGPNHEHMLLMRFIAFCRNKKKIKLLREQNPGCYLTLPDELDMKMDQVLTVPEFDRLVNLKAGPIE